MDIMVKDIMEWDREISSLNTPNSCWISCPASVLTFSRSVSFPLCLIHYLRKVRKLAWSVDRGSHPDCVCHQFKIAYQLVQQSRTSPGINTSQNPLQSSPPPLILSPHQWQLTLLNLIISSKQPMKTTVLIFVFKPFDAPWQSSYKIQVGVPPFSHI